MPQAYQQELDEFLSSKGLLGETEGNIQEDLDQFLKSKNLLGEPASLAEQPQPGIQDIQKDLDNFLWDKGLIEPGGLRRETLETEVEPPMGRPGIRALRPEEEYKGVPAWALERKLPKEMAGWSKDPKVNYISQKIAERAPLWLMAFAGAPAIIGIFEILQQVKNVTMSIKEKAKYDPLAHRMLSELIPEDAPDWLKYTSMVGEGAADMIIAAITAKKLSPKLFIKNLEAFHKKAVKAGQPAAPLKAAIERSLSRGRLRPETLDAELARAIKIRREPIPTPAAMRITGEPPPEVPLARLAPPAAAPLVRRPFEAPPPPEVPPLRPTVPPPPTEVPPPIRGAPPEAVPVRPEAVPAKVAPPAINVRPTAEGGWTIDLPQPPIKPPPEWAKPGLTIPWRPVEPTLLPPHVKPPKVIKPRKKPVFKNPFYEAINQLGGVAPNPDYPHSELKAIFPPDLIRKDGMPMDTLAQAMAHEFPTLEGDVELWEMADNIRRGTATFRDERTGDEHLPPREEVEAEAQAFADRKPVEMTKEEFNRDIKVAIKDLETGDIHKGRPEEGIHAEVWTRLRERGKLSKDMEAGFVLPNGQYIFSYSMKAEPGKEPTPGPKYDRETFHLELVKKAMAEGKYIPPEALAQHKLDYPELFKEPITFKSGDTVEFDTETGVRTGKIIGINEREGMATIRTKEGISVREFEDIKISEKPPEVVPKEAPRVAEKVPPIITKEPSLTEIEKVFEEMAIPRIKRGVLADQIIRNYKPEKGPLKTYIKSILPKITEEGELRVKPTLKRKRVEHLTPEMEEVVPGRAERPEDIFERAEEEARVQKIFKQSVKTDRERDILDRKILKGQSYDDIGKAHGITRQRAEQIFKQSFDKVKDHPDVIKMIERKMLQANLGPLPSKRDLDDIKKLIKKYFWSTRGVDKVVDDVNDTRLGNIYAEIFDATPEAKVVRKFLDEYKNPALDAMVLDAIKGEIPVAGSALPSNVIDAISTMRERMDRLSQLIMVHGAPTKETKASFESFMGKYIGKFYRLHNQRSWDPPKEVKDRFKAMLKRNHPERYENFTEEELDNFVEGIINEERKYGFGQKKEKRVPTGHYKKRLRLSPEWRELAGEYLDPVYLYLKTVSTQSAMAYNAEFLNKIKQTYPDMWVTNTTEAEARGWQKYRLPANYGYGELKNKYVHPELYNYITHEVDPVVSATEKVISKFIMNPFKITKTILSMPTQGRNLITNFALSLLSENFIFNPINFHWYGRAVKVFLGRNKGFHKEWTRLLRENVVGVEYYGSEVPKIQSDLMRIDPLDWGEKILKIMIAPAKLAVRKLGGLYNFNDALFRIATYYKRTEKFGETPKQAVDELDRSLQNYRKLPVAVDILRRFPVFGPFVSFKWNIGKIIVKQVTQATKETTAPRGSKTWWKGSKRLMRLGLFFGIPGILAAAFYEVFGVDEEKIKEIEKFLPKYRKHGMFLYFRGKEEQLKAVDLTYMFPTGDWSRAYRALKAGDIESFKDAIDLFSHPLFDAWSILIEGRQPYWGTKIQGGFFKRMAEIAKMLWLPASAPLPSMKSLTESMKAGKFEPREGALTGHQMRALIDAWNQEPDRYGKVRSFPEEVKAFFTGIKTWNVEPDRLLMQSIKAMRSEASELKWELTSWIASHTKAPAWEIKDRTDDFNKRITKLLEKAGEAMELYKELKKGGFLVQKEK
ncbi:MAG: sigma-70 family RNA polymerase sigma factor [candidate division Zixibacteria bacterium]|nr:sigma-70 family RNA polymerase sigma factor [candidate division Zixibacteria bacterium]